MLDFALDHDQRVLAEDPPVAGIDIRRDNPVDVAILILAGDEVETLRRRRRLVDDDLPGDADNPPIGAALQIAAAEDALLFELLAVERHDVVTQR